MRASRAHDCLVSARAQSRAIWLKKWLRDCIVFRGKRTVVYRAVNSQTDQLIGHIIKHTFITADWTFPPSLAPPHHCILCIAMR